MEALCKFYDEQENVKVRFIGFATDETRYDFGIVYTNQFFGKPLVICMQTGRSSLLDPKDLENVDYIRSRFRIQSEKQTTELIEFLKTVLPNVPYEPQYE